MKHEILIIDEEKADIDIGLNNIATQVSILTVQQKAMVFLLFQERLTDMAVACR